MSVRRTYASLTLAVSCCLVTCRKQPHDNSAHKKPATEIPAASTSSPKQAELEFVVRTLGGRDDEALPWLVAFHGLGDTPEDFAHVFDKLPVRAHVYLARAPITYGSGFDWFGARVAEHERLTEGIQTRLPSVAALLEKLSNNPNNAGSAVVTGFSQGGILSFAIAAADLPHVKAAIPIAGWLPSTLAAAPAMPVIAFHGEADSVVPFAQTQALVSGWQDQPHAATSIELHTYPSVKHTISAAMYKDWAIAVQQAIASPDR